jgi:YgiT-type zinc finger domain-containing protein
MQTLDAPYPEYDYGQCPCGGFYEPAGVQVQLTLADDVVVLPDVPQGQCPVCGSRVYKAEVLELIEAIFHGEQPLRTMEAAPPTA